MEKVSFKKVIKNDSYTVSLFFTSIVLAILIVIFFLRSDSVDEIGLYAVLGISGLSVGFLAIRLILILGFKPENKIYKAKVVKAFAYRSSRHIKFVYSVDGSEYTCKNALFSSKFSRELYKDDEIDVYISQSNPAKALIREAYFEIE